MKNPLRNAVFGLVVAVVAALAFVNAGTAGGTSTARNKLTLIAPAAPGGGWDGFAREGQQALKSGGVVNNPRWSTCPEPAGPSD